MSQRSNNESSPNNRYKDFPKSYEDFQKSRTTSDKISSIQRTTSNTNNTNLNNSRPIIPPPSNKSEITRSPRIQSQQLMTEIPVPMVASKTKALKFMKDDDFDDRYEREAADAPPVARKQLQKSKTSENYFDNNQNQAKSGILFVKNIEKIMGYRELIFIADNILKILLLLYKILKSSTVFLSLPSLLLLSYVDCFFSA